jgi:predicted nucleic acid-binding protein
MGTLQDRLAEHTRLALDTSVFIYHLEQHPRYSSLTYALLSDVESGRRTACTSVVTVMELTVRPWRLDRPDIARSYEIALARFPNLTLSDVTHDIARQAARLRAAYRLRPADALQAATGLVCGATLLITNDRDLGRLEPLIPVLVLEDAIP